MENNQSLLGQLDQDLVSHLVSNRRGIFKIGRAHV